MKYTHYIKRKIGNAILKYDARALMDEMYDILKEKFDGCHIIEFPHYVIGDSNHKFGTFGLHYHSLYDEYGKNAIDIICQRHSSKEEKILLDELMERYSYKFLELRHEIEKKHRAIEKKGKSIISTLADIQYRLMNAYKYHGYLNEYLDMKVQCNMLSVNFISINSTVLTCVKWASPSRNKILFPLSVRAEIYL